MYHSNHPDLPGHGGYHSGHEEGNVQYHSGVDESYESQNVEEMYESQSDDEVHHDDEGEPEINEFEEIVEDNYDKSYESEVQQEVPKNPDSFFMNEELMHEQEEKKAKEAPKEKSIEKKIDDAIENAKSE